MYYLRNICCFYAHTCTGKPLATIQSSNVSSVSRRPPTSNRLEKDLRRVLAQEDDYDRSKATSGVSSDSKSQKSKKGAVVTSECKSPVKGSSSKRHGESASLTKLVLPMHGLLKLMYVVSRFIHVHDWRYSVLLEYSVMNYWMCGSNSTSVFLLLEQFVSLHKEVTCHCTNVLIMHHNITCTWLNLLQ